MNIYVAAKFEKKEDVLKLYDRLKALGHTIAYDWTWHKELKPYHQNAILTQQYSEEELAGIADCDVFIYLSDEKGTTSLMEVGAALELNKVRGKPIIYAVGEWNTRSPWLMNARVRRRQTLDELLTELMHH